MEKITELIARLTAIECFCKDIHYTNVTYEDHLLADRLHDGIDTQLDDLKEQAILGEGNLPLSSKEYLKRAIEYIPDIKTDENRENWLNLLKLVEETKLLLNNFKVTDRGVNALLDNIAQNLSTAKALLFIQTRRTSNIFEDITHDHSAATETQIDREDFKRKEVKPNVAQRLALKYDAENVLVAEEDALERVAKKIGM